MFDYLRVKTGFYLLVFCGALLSAGTVFADTYQKTINSATAQAGITSSTAEFTDKDFHLSSAGEKEELAVNNITINYNGSLTDGLQTAGTVDMKNNTLIIEGGNKTLSGDNTAAKLTINNNASASNANLSLFNFGLKDNTVTLKSRIDESTGDIYGAVMESNDSGVGNANVTGNQIVLDSGAKVLGEHPALTGGILKINAERLAITSNADVSSNIVSVGALTNNEIDSNITGGKFIFNVAETGTHKNYNLTANLNGNQVNLTDGTFYGNITGAQAVTTTDAEYKTVTLGGNVQNNKINVSGGKYYGNVFVGGSVSLEGSGLGKKTSVDPGSSAAVAVNNNTITVTGGQFKDVIFVGGATTREVQYTLEPSGNITGNTIEISGTPTFQGSLYLYGGYTTGDTDKISGNTLSLKTGGIEAYGVDYFDTYKFDVTGASAGDVYLTALRGNGHNNAYFAQFQNGLVNGAIDLDGATFSWDEAGRPTALGVGQSVTLLKNLGSYGFSGTIANNGVQQDIVDSGNTYSYKVLQIGNRVELFHNGLTVGGDWSSFINIKAGSDVGEDVFMHVDSGTVSSASISVTSTANAVAELTAKDLDVTSHNITLQLNGTTGDKVKFNTITIGDDKKLVKKGSGFYSFDTMKFTGSGSGQVNSVDAFNGATSTVDLGAATSFDIINIGLGTTLTFTGAGSYDFNTLDVHGKGNTLTGDLAAANKALDFYLDGSTAAGDTALTVSGTADITDSNVKVGISGNSSPLKKEDQVVLLDAGTLTGAPVNTTSVGMKGLFLVYDFDLETVGNQLVATVTKAGLTQEAKAFSEGRAASLGLISQGSDFTAQTGIASAANAAWEQNSLALFTAFGGGRSRLETGSHVDMNNFNAMVGLSREVSIFKADFVVGSFVEYGHGKYDTYNQWAERKIKGSGNTDYTGLGAMARWYGQDGSYVEGVLHTGVSDTDFSGAVFFDNKQAKYDFDSWYYGGHFGVGHQWNLFDEFDGEVESDAVQIDGSVKYFLNHQESKSVSVSSGDELDFHEANSSRLRAGLKANFFASGAWRPYIGGAYDYELSGKAKASTYEMDIEAPSLRGGTGVGEIGLSYVTKGFTFGLGAEGYVGVRRGWSGNAKLGFTF